MLITMCNDFSVFCILCRFFYYDIFLERFLISIFLLQKIKKDKFFKKTIRAFSMAHHSCDTCLTRSDPNSSHTAVAGPGSHLHNSYSVSWAVLLSLSTVPNTGIYICLTKAHIFTIKFVGPYKETHYWFAHLLMFGPVYEIGQFKNLILNIKAQTNLCY